MAFADLNSFGEQLIAVGALGTAAFGLVDGSKAFRGGISNRGFGFIRNALIPFEAALARALGDNRGCDWRAVMRSHWISGRAKEEQKAIAVGLIQLGLTRENAETLALAGQVDPAALRNVVGALEGGKELSPEEINVLGRFKATIEARIDAAYDRADQVYRNSARFAAGVVAIMLAVLAARLMYPGERDASVYISAILVGLVAVPLAPIAKDVASALSTAASALGRRVAR